ncbi:histidine kinase [Streptomyces sp. NBC_00193]|uniref:sensor histidine kinase n=1 Tax=Streptomyces sp. NBC_00193 TaxID=2975675 RepID=UPI002250725F|nr:histidine kinase [Streptomyces sp. NBC_00193]MCX5299846.1 histidine kinase [Streptomyces sp. NBC_00193]
MHRLFRAALRPVTYSRWVHLCVPILMLAVWMFIEPEAPWVPLVLVIPLGLLPWMRVAEGLQAQFLLTPSERNARGTQEAEEISFSTVGSQTWTDRWRTLLWLEIRLVVSLATMMATVWLPMLTLQLVTAGLGSRVSSENVIPAGFPVWAAWALAPVPPVLLIVVVVLLGDMITAIARRLLGPSAAERLTALEVRTEQLLERTRIARELHDSIGHALTVAVVQAGAARAAGDPEFTDRALSAIEETGRAALEDLDRVLRVLRESGQRPSQRPTLVEADRLFESARASGATVDAQLVGPLDQLPDPVSQEGYRILQEALTNVLRHCGPVPVRVRIGMVADRLDLEVTNPLPDRPSVMTGGGTGLRGMRERAALLGGDTETGPYKGGWRVRTRLPLERIR